jgi:hypothetical protein
MSSDPGKSAQLDPPRSGDLRQIKVESIARKARLAGMYLAFLPGEEIETEDCKDESHNNRGKRDHERG